MLDFEEKQAHPSYGMLGFSRVTGGTTHLFGSSITHNNTIRMRLKEGSFCRGLHHDWYSGGKTIVEVEMSQSQFADLITSLNIGDGIPVTIRYLNGEQIEEPPFKDKRETLANEFSEKLNAGYEKAQALIKQVSELFSEKKALTKADKEEILCKLNMISADIGGNLDFAMKSFNEQTDKTVTEAKAEVEAFIENKLLSFANKELVENRSSLIEGMRKEMPSIDE